jgi:hypothetical protein
MSHFAKIDAAVRRLEAKGCRLDLLRPVERTALINEELREMEVRYPPSRHSIARYFAERSRARLQSEQIAQLDPLAHPLSPRTPALSDAR